jgi:hypothetical protein
MAGTLGFENQLRQDLATLDCPAGSFAVIADVPPGRISQAINGQKDFGGEESMTLKKVLDEMKLLVASVDPIPINFKNALAIKYILEKRREESAGDRSQLLRMLRELRISSEVFTNLQYQDGQILPRFVVEQLLDGRRVAQYEIAYLLKLARGLQALVAGWPSNNPLDLAQDHIVIKQLLAQRADELQSGPPKSRIGVGI